MRYGNRLADSGLADKARPNSTAGRNSSVLVVADILLGEQAECFGQLLFQHERRFGDAFGRRIRGTKELGEHPADAPAVVQFPRPGKLHIGLRTEAGNLGRSRRKGDTDDGREVDLAGDRTDLPFDRGRDVVKPEWPGARTLAT